MFLTEFVNLAKAILFNHMGSISSLKNKIHTDETNMFAKKTQTLMKIANMEFHPTLNKK